jgi:hypothetical protein
MQYERRTLTLAGGVLVAQRRLLAATVLALSGAACTSSAPVVMTYHLEPAPPDDPGGFAFFTTDPRLHAAALPSLERIRVATGESALVLAGPERAATCQAFQAGCGFELSFADVVYCFGDPEPALACTSQGLGGKTLRVQMQAELSGGELENRLIHEFFHVITRNQAPHSADGLFMEYSVGTEGISQSTLESVCEHFACSQFRVEEELSPDRVAGR